MKAKKGKKAKEQNKEEKKLKIIGSFEDVLKIAVSDNPKPAKKKK